jgi:hypothetical protein
MEDIVRFGKKNGNEKIRGNTERSEIEIGLRREIGESGEDTGGFVGERRKFKRDIGTF